MGMMAVCSLGDDFVYLYALLKDLAWYWLDSRVCSFQWLWEPYCWTVGVCFHLVWSLLPVMRLAAPNAGDTMNTLAVTPEASSW